MGQKVFPLPTLWGHRLPVTALALLARGLDNNSMFYQFFLFHFSLTSLVFQHQTDPSKCSYIALFKVIFVKPVPMLHSQQFSYLVIYLVIIHLLPNTNTRDEWRNPLYLAINLVIRQTPSPIYLPQSWRLGFYNWDEEFVVLGVT